MNWINQKKWWYFIKMIPTSIVAVANVETIYSNLGCLMVSFIESAKSAEKRKLYNNMEENKRDTD
ncbi:hypothetical protein KYJ26_22030 [Bacillus sp. MCCB 382]|uniref:hypothetical protein n=1 Tax=Bacillus sp. MCCB 382 TaxID=2860197 RepID=UPI001C595B56|nr:hypothetical protein [Bacillus sp. MCCB 382]